MVQWELEVNRVRVDDVELGYMEIGKGEPLVMIMGLWGTMDQWDIRFVRNLAKEHRVIMFDNRGMGFSTASDRLFSIELFADDAAGLIGALGLGKTDVLGWSLGSDIALELALRHPKCVKRLVLYAGSCGGDECVPASPVIEDLLSKENLTYQEAVQSMFPDDWNAMHQSIWEYYPKVRKETPQKEIDRQAEAAENYRGCFSRLKDLKAPVLIVNGMEDLDCPPENALILQEEIRDAQVYMIDGAGHGAMYQKTDELSQAVLEFLR